MNPFIAPTPTATNAQAPVAQPPKPAVANAPATQSTPCCANPQAAPKNNRRQGRKQH